MKKLVAYSVDATRCAQQIVHEAFVDILCGNFNVPSLNQMEDFLKDVIDYSFDEYEEMKQLVARYPSWSQDQLNEALYSRKIRYDREHHENLRQAAIEAIQEVENLLASLNDAIKAWKIKHLE